MMRAVTHLMTACMVIVGGLGARSAGEALRLRVGCLLEPEPGSHDLALSLEEGIRDLGSMPVPSIVAHAYRVLERLAADTRAVTGGDRLFEFVRRPWNHSVEDSARRQLGFPKRGYLADFCIVNGLPAVDPETGAALTGDQLQLGFAVAYHHVAPGLPTEALTRARGKFDPLELLDYVEGRLPGAAAHVAELVRARKAAHRDAAGQAGIETLRALAREL